MWFSGQIVLAALTALAIGNTARRRVLAALFLLAGAVIPWLSPADYLTRILLTLVTIIALMKAIEISVTPGPWPAWLRLWHTFELFNVCKVKFARPAIEWRQVVKIALLLSIVAVTKTVRHVDTIKEPAHGLFQMLLAAIIIYSAFEAVTEIVRLLHRAAGMIVPPIQINPIMSRSVGEFWGSRWNRPVGEWLHKLVFMPLARRNRSSLGIVAAFAVSGALHAWMFSPTGLIGATMMAAFFLLQGPIVLLEMRLKVRRWPTALARAWTYVMLLATSPLFFYPLLGWV